jgi:hypothetical protein
MEREQAAEFASRLKSSLARRDGFDGVDVDGGDDADMPPLEDM